MEIKKLNIYQRLRDFHVPASVLDMVFEDKDDLNQLITAWDVLKSDGLTDDETAREISDIFFKEIDIQIEDE